MLVLRQHRIDGVLAISLTERAHKYVSEVLGPGDIAIDATMGNGYDTLFLAGIVGHYGKVYAFDIQPAALENTRRRLLNHGMDKQVELVLGGHEDLLAFVPIHVSNRIKAVMFNLGYRPNSDKRIITSVTTTLVALGVAVKILAVSGRITVVAYTGHRGGGEEADAVKTFVKSLFVHDFRITWETPEIKGRNPPRLVVIEKFSN